MNSNTSGQGKASEIPAEIRGWNWGAFLLTWIWGIGNNTYRAFWVFFPFVNFIMLIALGLKGNEWAWSHRKWGSVEEFKQVQRNWTKAGLILLVVSILFLALMIFGIGGIFKSSDAYKMSFNYVSNSQEVISHLGTPIKSGFVSGSIQTSGPDGTASIAYTIDGPKGEADVAVRAVKDMGRWSIKCLVVNYKESIEKTILVPCK